MQIFLTGATGVIGRRVVPLLVREGHSVTAVCRTSEKRLELIQQGATPLYLDLFDPDAVKGAVEGHEAVVNLATHIPTTFMSMMMRSGWRENDHIRRDASGILVDAAIDSGVSRFIQESFAPIYEDNGNRWIDEEWTQRPVEKNRSVLDAERSAIRFAASGGTGIVLRFAGFYGPDSPHTLSMMESIAKGWSSLPGDPEAFFTSIHLDDAASAVVASLRVDSGVYNIAENEPATRREIATTIASSMGAPAPRFAPAWMGKLAGSMGELMSRSQRVSNRKFRAASGWEPVYKNIGMGWHKVLSDVKQSMRKNPESRMAAAL